MRFYCCVNDIMRIVRIHLLFSMVQNYRISVCTDYINKGVRNSNVVGRTIVDFSRKFVRQFPFRFSIPER